MATFRVERTSFGFTVFADGSSRAMLSTASKTKAESVARALNGVIREATFVAKNPGRRSRSKGHAFEREVSIALREIFPEARRHLENHKADAAKGVDVVGVGQFRIQCKKLKTYAPLARLIEIPYDDVAGDVPVLVTAADGEPPIAAVRFDDFLWLLKRALRDG